ncbi:unnamed protein product [Leuciscus chuanchicus]
MLSFFLLLFFMDGVCGAETEAVMEGDSVTLHTDLTDIRNDDTILWLFGPKDSVISQITRKGDLNSIFLTDDVRFRDRLQVDQNTGSLTIRNTRIRHSGQYKLSISRKKTTKKIFNVTVFGVVGKTDEVKSVSVKEGESVTLKTDVELKRDDLIVWRFGDKGILLAKMYVETNESSLNEADERFRDRLKLDHQTGSLTITNTRTEHSGLYELQIRGRESSQRFLLSVSAVPDPGLSPGGIAGIAVAVLLVLVVVVIYFHCTISKLKKQVANTKSVAEEDVPLKTGVKIQPGVLILWTFGLKNCLVARADSKTADITERFSKRLELDPQTGSLTIKNIKNAEYGHYKLQISNKEKTTFRRFIVNEPAETKLEAEEENVFLETGVEIQPGDLIVWMFGAKNCLVARADSSTTDTELFRDRLELDPRTGSLTIKNITNREYGYYKLQIINKEQTTFRRFNVLEPGVCGAETEAVMEGDSVTLHTNLSDIRNDDTILWLFGPKDSVVSQITRKGDLNSIYFTDDVRFRDRLQVDQNTGSLTIRNTRIRHSGQYKLSISREKTTIKIFNVTVFGVVGKTDEVKSVSVMEGESVTLKTDVEVKRDDLIVWWFGDEGILLAKIDVETNESSLNEADERFRDRLKLDHQTGSLTITNTRTEHSGLYELQIRGRESSQRFLLSVSAVSDPGLSPGAIAGIVVATLLVAAVLAAVVIYYRRKISELQKQNENKVSVEEGDYPVLLTGTKLHDKIEWYYEDEHKDKLIAEMNKVIDDSVDGRFRGNLKLNDQTGDLTITDIRTIHSGLYILKISSGKRTKYKRFIVSVAVDPRSVAEGSSTTLKNTAKIQEDDLLLWMFGAEKSLVAINATRTFKTDERFAGRVKLDETGSLTITNISPTHSGHYKLQIINSKETTCRRFNVTVTATGSQENESVTASTPLLKEYVREDKQEGTTPV